MLMAQWYNSHIWYDWHKMSTDNIKGWLVGQRQGQNLLITGYCSTKEEKHVLPVLIVEGC